MGQHPESTHKNQHYASFPGFLAKKQEFQSLQCRGREGWNGMKGWQYGVACISRARVRGQVSILWDGCPRPSFRVCGLNFWRCVTGLGQKQRAGTPVLDSIVAPGGAGYHPTPQIDTRYFTYANNPKTCNIKPQSVTDVLNQKCYLCSDCARRTANEDEPLVAASSRCEIFGL